MRNTLKRAYAVYILVFAFFAGLVFMMYTFVTHGRSYVVSRVNSHLYTNRVLTTAGTIFDRNGEVLVSTENENRVFSKDYEIRRALLHTIGDTEGFISTGVQTLYRSYLIGYDFIDGVYKTVKDGAGNDIKLTVDSELCRTAYEALGSRRGTVAVYNYKTGEVVCKVSKPTYDPSYKPSDMSGKEYEGVYIDRFLSGVFTPGSTFKIITAVCALENIPDINTRTFNCTGTYKTKDGPVICSGVHGEVTFEKALNCSCNCAFAEIALELGAKRLGTTAKELGFNRQLNACGVNTHISYFNLKKANRAEIGWAGIGQHTTLANPCNMLMIAGAIANGGTCVTPKLIQTEPGSSLSRIINKVKGDGESQITIDPAIAETLKAMLRSNVKNYYGEYRFPDLEMCGKTGSAEINGDLPHSWFVGFSQRQDLPYAIVVIAENSGLATSIAVPIASQVMSMLKYRFTQK